MGKSALSSPAPEIWASCSSSRSELPTPCPLLPALKNIPRPCAPRARGTPCVFPRRVSSSQRNVTNPSTEEAALQGQAELVGKNTECAGTSHPIHHCPCLPVVPSPHCLAENWPSTRAPSPGVLEPSAEGGPASISTAHFPGFALLESTLLPKYQAPALIFCSLTPTLPHSTLTKAVGGRKAAGNDSNLPRALCTGTNRY